MRTVDGRTFKTGVLFRSDDLSRMTDQDVAKLHEFNLKLICDLRSTEESWKRQPRVAPQHHAIRMVNIPIGEHGAPYGIRKQLLSFLFGKEGGDRFREFGRAYYHNIAFEQTARIREVVRLLSKEENLPALIHCTAGKDRTGFLAAMIQLLAGIPYDMVMDDYLRTNDYFAIRLEKFIRVMRVVTLFQVPPARIRLILMTHPEFLDEVHATIVKRYGSVETYLCEACEIDRDTLHELKNRLLA